MAIDEYCFRNGPLAQLLLEISYAWLAFTTAEPAFLWTGLALGFVKIEHPILDAKIFRYSAASYLNQLLR